MFLGQRVYVLGSLQLGLIVATLEAARLCWFARGRESPWEEMPPVERLELPEHR